MKSGMSTLLLVQLGRGQLAMVQPFAEVIYDQGVRLRHPGLRGVGAPSLVGHSSWPARSPTRPSASPTPSRRSHRISILMASARSRLAGLALSHALAVDLDRADDLLARVDAEANPAVRWFDGTIAMARAWTLAASGSESDARLSSSMRSPRPSRLANGTSSSSCAISRRGSGSRNWPSFRCWPSNKPSTASSFEHARSTRPPALLATVAHSKALPRHTNHSACASPRPNARLPPPAPHELSGARRLASLARLPPGNSSTLAAASPRRFSTKADRSTS